MNDCFLAALLGSQRSRDAYTEMGSEEEEQEVSPTSPHAPSSPRRLRRRLVSEDPTAFAQDLGFEVLPHPENLVEANRMANNYMVSRSPMHQWGSLA